jgi:hypothetical protein
MGRGVLDIMDFELETFWVGEVLYLRDRNGGYRRFIRKSNDSRRNARGGFDSRSTLLIHASLDTFEKTICGHL